MPREPTLDEQRRYVQQWAETGRLLEELRRKELRELTPEDSRRTVADFSRLAGLLPPDPMRDTRTSGLVQMQALFMKQRDPRP